jgi:hypothetical protein
LDERAREAPTLDVSTAVLSSTSFAAHTSISAHHSELRPSGRATSMDIGSEVEQARKL